MKFKRHLEEVAQTAISTGVLNALINGIINWFMVRSQTELFLTTDSISSKENTVLGGAVILATSLAIILTSIGYFTFKSAKKPPYFPKGFMLTLKNAFFTFGVIITLSILLQRFAGSIAVAPISSAIIVAIIAGLVAGIIDYLTINELLRNHYDLHKR
jgi:hypothetical protein